LQMYASAQRVDNSTRMFAEFSASVSSNSGVFYIVSGLNAGFTGWTSLSKGVGGVSNTQAAGITDTAGVPVVLSAQHNIPGDLSTIRRNQVAGTNGTGDKGTGNFGNHPLYIGSRGGSSLRYSGLFYGLVFSGGLGSVLTVASAEQYLARKSGVTL
jgi:hypothetical protein